MQEISRAKALGAASAIALVGPALMNKFIFAAEKADKGDIAILQSAISLERAGIKAYADAAGLKILSKPVLDVAVGFMNDHIAHRDALIAAVKASGTTPTEETTKLTYPSLKTQEDILGFALVVERIAAKTYLETLSKFKNRELAEIAGSILGVETTHVAILSEVLKKPAYPGHFVTS